MLTSQLRRPPLTLTTLHSFIGSPDDGWGPVSGVVIGAGGVLYGSTGYGGSSYDGTAFSLTPPASVGGPWTESVYSFPGGWAGNSPTGTFAIAPNVVIGSTLDPHSGGSIFSMHPPTSSGGAWAERILYEFTDYPSQGEAPNTVTIGSGGVLYGTTRSGGNSACAGFGPGCGTVFSLTPPAIPGSGGWTETVLHYFAGPPNDGYYPTANLVIGAGGVLYGTTAVGGANDSGALFSLTPPGSPDGAWTETVIYSFPPLIYGYMPGRLVMGPNGVLYCTTAENGAGNPSTVFSLTPPPSPGAAWRESVVHSFAGGPSDGDDPNSLVIGSGGVLYGATGGGGPANNGTLFSLTPPNSAGVAWTESVLYYFTGGSDGANLNAVVMGSGGVL